MIVPAVTLVSLPQVTVCEPSPRLIRPSFDSGTEILVPVEVTNRTSVTQKLNALTERETRALYPRLWSVRPGLPVPVPPFAQPRRHPESRQPRRMLERSFFIGSSPRVE